MNRYVKVLPSFPLFDKDSWPVELSKYSLVKDLDYFEIYQSAGVPLALPVNIDNFEDMIEISENNDDVLFIIPLFLEVDTLKLNATELPVAETLISPIFRTTTLDNFNSVMSLIYDSNFKETDLDTIFELLSTMYAMDNFRDFYSTDVEMIERLKDSGLSFQTEFDGNPFKIVMNNTLYTFFMQRNAEEYIAEGDLHRYITLNSILTSHMIVKYQAGLEVEEILAQLDLEKVSDSIIRLETDYIIIDDITDDNLKEFEESHPDVRYIYFAYKDLVKSLSAYSRLIYTQYII